MSLILIKGMYKMIFNVEDNGNVRLENRITDAMSQNIFYRPKEKHILFPTIIGY